MGFPWGSIFEPLLFMFFINELTRQCSKCGMDLYADETILGGSAQTLNELGSYPAQGFPRWKSDCFKQSIETPKPFVEEFFELFVY